MKYFENRKLKSVDVSLILCRWPVVTFTITQYCIVFISKLGPVANVTIWYFQISMNKYRYTIWSFIWHVLCIQLWYERVCYVFKGLIEAYVFSTHNNLISFKVNKSTELTITLCLLMNVVRWYRIVYIRVILSCNVWCMICVPFCSAWERFLVRVVQSLVFFIVHVFCILSFIFWSVFYQVGWHCQFVFDVKCVWISL